MNRGLPVCLVGSKTVVNTVNTRGSETRQRECSSQRLERNEMGYSTFKFPSVFELELSYSFLLQNGQVFQRK